MDLLRLGTQKKERDEVAYLLGRCDFFTEDKIERGENVWNILDKVETAQPEISFVGVSPTICTIQCDPKQYNFMHMDNWRALRTEIELDKGIKFYQIIIKHLIGKI